MLEAVATARRAPTTCECGAPVPWGSHFCANCGRPVGAEPVVACEGCGHPLSADATFCAQLRPPGRDETSRPEPEAEAPKPSPSRARSRGRGAGGRRDDPALGRSLGALSGAARGRPALPALRHAVQRRPGVLPRVRRAAARAAEPGHPARRTLAPAAGLVSRRLDLAGAARARGRRRRGRRLGRLARRRLELGQRHGRPHAGRLLDERPDPDRARADARRRRRRPRTTAAPPPPPPPKPAARRVAGGEERLDDRARLGADHQRPRRSGRRGQAGAAPGPEAGRRARLLRASPASTPATTSSSSGSTATRPRRRAT